MLDPDPPVIETTVRWGDSFLGTIEGEAWKLEGAYGKGGGVEMSRALFVMVWGAEAGGLRLNPITFVDTNSKRKYMTKRRREEQFSICRGKL